MDTLNNGSHIGIIGCGAWATTIANHIAKKGIKTKIWCHRQEIVDEINSQVRSLLPDVAISKDLQASLDFNEVVGSAQALVLCVPARYLESVIEHWRPMFKPNQPVLSLIKGIFSEKYILVESYLNSIFKNISYSLLSGPNLALEIAQEKPAAAVVASTDIPNQLFFQNLLSNEFFRIYRSDDVVGVALGGILKNIMAIAAGCIDALSLGINTKSALITRGLIEIIELGKTLNAHEKSFYGLAGVGDLIATCSSPLSRNYQCGYAIGSGKTLAEFQESLSSVAEGVQSTRFIYAYSREKRIIMPITTMVYNIVHNKVSITEAINQLMTRDLKSE
tara:strand:- start:1567 stop:2568 length:1002 start_codon:yes stop_codon:yes gene_type:complete